MQRRTQERQADDWRWEPASRFPGQPERCRDKGRRSVDGQQHAEHWLPSGPAGPQRADSGDSSSCVALLKKRLDFNGEKAKLRRDEL
jgi:hypothetical protein